LVGRPAYSNVLPGWSSPTDRQRRRPHGFGWSSRERSAARATTWRRWRRRSSIPNEFKGRETIPNDFVFAMVGGHPPIKWLQSIGVEYTEKPHSWSPPRTDDLAQET
jgi:hypothetical protein